MKRRLICSVCGAYAGLFEQHHNRDTGWGICPACVTWLRNRGETGEALQANYGAPGINYQDPDQPTTQE